MKTSPGSSYNATRQRAAAAATAPVSIYKPIVRKSSKQQISQQQHQQHVSLELKLRPLETFYSQLDQRKLARSRVDALSLRSPASFINSACLSLNLSDTLLNIFRDINFDSCTLCVCMHHTIKGVDYPLYICQDIFDVADESNMNVYNASAGCLSQPQHQNDPTPSQTGPGASDANVSLQGYFFFTN